MASHTRVSSISSTTGSTRRRALFGSAASLRTRTGSSGRGFSHNLRIPSSPKFKALLISDLAVGYDQGQPIVYVVGADDVAKADPVKLGALSEGLRVVESGLSRG